MVLLNSFFNACCDDIDNNDNNQIHPHIHPHIHYNPTENPNNNNNNDMNLDIDHHHHLLHLHHHDPDNSSKKHTHDIIFHHHNSNNCNHDNNSNHHHHLHFEDQLNGQKIKHDFILPDCDLPINTTPNKKVKSKKDTKNINNNKEKDKNKILKPEDCSDFLTSSVCNLDSIFNNNINTNTINNNNNNNDNDNNTGDGKYIEQRNGHYTKHNYCNHNLKLPSQNCQNNPNCKPPFCSNSIPHHYLHHHIENDIHNQHFHSNIQGHNKIKSENENNENDNKNDDNNDNNTETIIKNEFLSDNDEFLTCKWDSCNEEIETELINKHLFENHLQNLHLSPDNFKDEFNDNIKLSNLKLHCEWDDCEFFTDNVDLFLKHVPEHTELLKNIKTETSEEDNGELHDNDNHNNNDKHICKWIINGEKCDEIFENTELLTNHIIDKHISSGKSEYICNWEGCNRDNKPFTQKQKIIRHLNTHTKHKPFECNICGKKFSLDLMLKQHMRIHTGEKPYKCDICGKTFKTSSSLTIHLRIHSGDKPMICKICGKRFNESSNLNKHMKIHFREYKCDYCMKSFDCEIKFKRHKLSCKKRVL